MSRMNWRAVVEQAKKQYVERERYGYFYGAKGQVLTDSVMNTLWKAEPAYFARYTDEQKSAIFQFSRGKIGLDCSAFICMVLERAGAMAHNDWIYSTGLIGRCTGVTTNILQTPAASLLYKSVNGGRHIGIDIGGGQFLHMAREGNSIELGKNREYDWQQGGQYPTVDYLDWKEDGNTAIGNTALCGLGIATGIANEAMCVRNAPVTGTWIGTVMTGQKVEILQKLKNGWLKIVWPGAKEGYAYTSNAGGRYYWIL